MKTAVWLFVVAVGVVACGAEAVAGAEGSATQGARGGSGGWAASNQIPSALHDDVMKRAMAKSCSHRYTITCLKLDVVSFVDRLSDTEELQVLPGVTVVRENASGAAGEGASARRFPPELMAALAKDYPHDVDARVDAFLARRLGHYLDTHAVNVRLMDAATAAARHLSDDALRAVGLGSGGGDDASSGRKGGGGGGKKGYGQLLAMGMMMKGMMGAMAMAGVAAIAGKALIVGLMALTLAAIAGLKSLTSGGGSKAVTYEIVSKPVYSHEHSHSHEVQHGHGGGGGYGHSSYGRSFDEAPPEGARAARGLADGPDVYAARDAHDLAYNGYLKGPHAATALPVAGAR